MKKVLYTATGESIQHCCGAELDLGGLTEAQKDALIRQLAAQL